MRRLAMAAHGLMRQCGQDQQSGADDDCEHTHIEEECAGYVHLANQRQMELRRMRSQKRIAECERTQAGDRSQQQADGEPA